MRVRWTRPAIGRLAEIRRYISENNPENAKLFIRSLYQRVSSQLEMFPHLGRMVREMGDSSYRELIYRRYRVIYIVAEDEVIILTVRSPYQAELS